MKQFAILILVPPAHFHIAQSHHLLYPLTRPDSLHLAYYKYHINSIKINKFKSYHNAPMSLSPPAPATSPPLTPTNLATLSNPTNPTNPTNLTNLTNPANVRPPTQTGYVQTTGNSQVYIPNASASYSASSYYLPRAANTNLVSTSRVTGNYLPSSQAYISTSKPEPFQVFTASGKPIPPPPLYSNTQLESAVRPVSTLSNTQSIPFSSIVQSRPIVFPTQNTVLPPQAPIPVQVNPPLTSTIEAKKDLAVSTALPQQQSVRTIQSTKYIDGPTVYETVQKEAYDSGRESRKKLYESSGYVDKKKGSPCCWALLGLLLLAGLLTGLYFLVRAISSSAGPAVDKPADIPVNGTTSNNTSNTNATANSTTVTPSGPPVIDANSNPKPATTNTTTTTTTVNSSSSGSVAPSTVNATSTSGLFTLPPNYVPPTSTTNSTTTVPATVTNTTSVTVTNPASNTTNNNSSGAVSPQLYYSDPNIQTIDKFLRTQDAYRLGSNPTLTALSVQSINGTNYYYLTETTAGNKNYMYGVSMENGQPNVKSVSISQGSAGHALSVKVRQEHLQGIGVGLRRFSA